MSTWFFPGSKVGAIVGGVVGGLVFMLFCAGIVVCVLVAIFLQRRGKLRYGHGHCCVENQPLTDEDDDDDFS